MAFKMPMRRVSGSTSAAAISSMSRHRPGDLSLDSTSNDFGLREQTPTMGELRIINALVQRLQNKLPCNSGTGLVSMELDSGVQTAVQSIRQLAEIRLPLVVQSLMQALETLAKYSSTTTLHNTPLDTLHSQLYLLHVLYSCFSASWRSHASSSTSKAVDLRLFPDPPPFDDSLARSLLSTLLLYTHMVTGEHTANGRASPISTGKEKEKDKTKDTAFIHWSKPSTSSDHLGPKFLRQHSYPLTLAEPPGLVSSDCTTVDTTIERMTDFIARIVFYLSASNWPYILGRIKNRLSHLTTTIDESPDLTELHLIEWANVDRTRLSHILDEMSTSFLNIKRPAQTPTATVIRRAIWNFISAYTLDFNTLIESNTKIEGNPDILFDMLYGAADLTSSSNARRTKAFYPLMAMLMVLCPDILSKALSGSRGSGISKKSNYFETLRKGLSSKKGFEACAMCYVKFVRAASMLRRDDSGIKNLIPQIQEELKNALFSSANPEIDEDFLVDGLVSLYRNNPATGSTIFQKLLMDSSDQHKLLAVRSAVYLISEGSRIPWHPPIADLWQNVSAYIRALLKGKATGLLGDLAVAKRPRGSIDLPQVLNDTIMDSLKIIILDPAFAFSGSPIDASPEGLRQTLAILGAFAIGPTPEVIRIQATKTVVAIMDHITRSPNDSVIAAANSAISEMWTVYGNVSRQALHDFQSVDFDSLASSAEALKSMSLAILRLRTILGDNLVLAENAKTAVMMAGLSSLTSLLGLNMKATTITTPTLLALHELNIVVIGPALLELEKDGPSSQNFQKAGVIRRRLNIYGELGHLPPPLGRQHFQRQLRSVVRKYTIPSPVSQACFAGLYACTKTLTGRILAADNASSSSNHGRKAIAGGIDGLSEAESRFWQDSVCVIAAISGCCVGEGASETPRIQDVVGTGILPKVYEDLPEPSIMTERFLRDCVDLLVCNSITVRDTIKEALGSELPPSLCKVMLVQMTKMLGHAIGPNGITVSPAFTVFVDQAIAILKINVDRMQKGENSLQIDMGDILYLMAQYAFRLGRDESAIRVKTRFCQLVEAVLLNPDYVTLSNCARFRGSMLEWMSEWSSDTIRDDVYHLSAEVSGRHQKDLDIACLRAMVPITDGLALRGAGDDDDAQGVAKSRLFYRHYVHLVKILERTIGVESESFQHRSVSNQTIDRVSYTSDDPSTLAISALSNLLSANIDVGLKHCLTLGYHEDPNLRTAFMQLLINILKHGARFGGLTTKKVNTTIRPYLDLLTSGNMALALGMVEVCPPGEVDEISQLLFRVFEAKGTLLTFVSLLIDREVTNTTHEADLFRANTITTRILTLYAKSYGYNYIRATLQPLVASLADKPDRCSFELDPSKASPDEDIERNAEYLRLMSQALLDLISTSIARIPIMFKALCNHIWEVVEDRFPDSRHSAVGSFIFLRFFCPSIVAPEQIDLDVTPDTRENRRALLLITKVIQNLANNVVFGNKEPHMKILNAFLSENIRQVTAFLSDVAVKPRPADVEQEVKIYQEEAESNQDPDGDEAIIHRFAFKHFPKLETALESMPTMYRHPNSKRPANIDLEGQPALAKIKVIMDQSGTPADTGKLGASARASAYDDFMRRNQGRSTDSVSTVFYEGPASQNGRRIFYFIMARVGTVDHDLLLYHIFLALDNIVDIFDLVLDLTDYSPVNEMPMAWLRRGLQICPPGLLPSINCLALYNPNTYSRRRVRRVIAEVQSLSGPIGRTICAVSSPSELAEFIPFTSLELSDQTMQLAFEAEHVFTNLLLISDHEAHLPVVVKIGQNCLQIASWRKLDVTSAMKAYIIDIIRLKDVDDISVGSGLTGDHITIKHKQSESVTFISRKRDEMVQTIRSSRARVREAPDSDRALRPSDVPGTLINIALLNLSSDDEILRLGAYNLLNELGQFFKYDVSSQIIPVTSGLTLPTNSLAFTVNISKTLAASAPQLTLEVLKEWTIGYMKASTAQRAACLLYVQPWLANLETFAKPTQENSERSIRQVTEILRSLIAITITERARSYLALQQQIWLQLAAFPRVSTLLFNELVQVAVEAGVGSERSGCAADILVSIASTPVKGKVLARLRKVIAQTHLRPAQTLPDHSSWSEICVLTRLAVLSGFNPSNSMEVQLYLPEICHIITILLGSGTTSMRQTVYGLMINALHCLATSKPTMDMDGPGIQALLKRASEAKVLAWFGLRSEAGSFELSSLATPSNEGESIARMLNNLEELAKFLGEIMEAAAVSTDCLNSWRARWMSLVSATCFQHNPAAQPQALTILGYLAAEEVDDDIVYQILVAMSTTLSNLAEVDNILLVSMTRCLSRIIPGISSDSRYTGSLFWLAVGLLQLSWIPISPAALELLLTSLRSMTSSGIFAQGLMNGLLDARSSGLESARLLDTITHVNFDTDPNFSLVGVIFKYARHPSTRKLAVDCLLELLRLSSSPTGRSGAEEETPMIGSDSLAFFMSLLPVSAGNPADLKEVFAAAGLAVSEESLGNIGDMAIFELLHIPDNSTALLLITLVTAILHTATSDTEKLVLYRFLAESAIQIPDVLSLSYDSLIPRMTAVLASTSNTTILSSVTSILTKALTDPGYIFPSGPGYSNNNSNNNNNSNMVSSESMSSLHQKSYSASISSMPSGIGAGGGKAEGLLEEMGMKGLADLSFPPGRMERVGPMAKWVASLIEGSTI